MLGDSAHGDPVEQATQILEKASPKSEDFATLRGIIEEDFISINFVTHELSVSPLIWAVYHKPEHPAEAPKLINYLLGRGAYVNILDKDNDTPLDAAEQCEDGEVLELLSSHGGVRGGPIPAAAPRSPTSSAVSTNSFSTHK